MTETLRILETTQPAKLVDQLMEAGYGFAVWRMPEKDEMNILVSLRNPQQLKNVELSDLPIGFLINNYADNHPIKPYFLQGDLIIRNSKVWINPEVKDVEIDQFKQRIQKKANRPSVLHQKLEDTCTQNRFEDSVARAVQAIKNGKFEKVVLSRFSEEKLPDHFSAWAFFEKICDGYSNAFCSLSHIPGLGLWIGASPELLLSDDGSRFKTIALAGTKVLSENQPLSEIPWTQKEIEEQALVCRYIINCFKKIRLREFHEHGPKTVKAGHLAHLKTEFEVNYREIQFERLADQMLELLHPTSAVCGMPIEDAKPWIEKEEGYNREFYAGFLGPVHFEGSTDLFVNLRCMKVDGNAIRFYAGAGITADSNPKREYEETEMKMNVLKRFLN